MLIFLSISSCRYMWTYILSFLFPSLCQMHKLVYFLCTQVCACKHTYHLYFHLNLYYNLYQFKFFIVNVPFYFYVYLSFYRLYYILLMVFFVSFKLQIYLTNISYSCCFFLSGLCQFVFSRNFSISSKLRNLMT